MELTYSTTRTLVARAYWRSLRRSRRHQVLWLVWVACGFVLGATAGTAHPVRTGLLASAGVVALLALVPLVLFKPQRRVLRVGPSGLETRIGAKAGEVAWRAVARVERDGDQVVVTGRSLNAFLVPASAFPSAAACDEAVAQWQAWQRAAAAPAA